MITQLSPGRRARLARLGIHPSRIGRVCNTAAVEPKNIPVPKNADELAEFFGDPGRYAQVLTNKEALQKFIEDYGKEQQGDGTELQRTVAAETQKQLAAYLKEKELDGDEENRIKRLNLDPQNSTKNKKMLASYGQGAAHNPKAPGAVIDKMFASAVDYLANVWHLNEGEEAAKVRASIRNAAASVVPADGGFLVPETLRSQLLEIALETAVVRPRATVVPMETARVPFPSIDVTSHTASLFGGMIAYWGEESAALTDANPKFSRVVLDANKLTGLSVVPNELLADSLMSFSALIERLWPMTLSFEEDDAFQTGTGDGMPLGYLNNPASIAVAKESGQAAATVEYANICNMYARMMPSSINRAAWVISHDVLPQLMQMVIPVGTGGAPLIVMNASAAMPMSIFGRPLIITEKSPALGTQGDIAFVDLNYYLVGDRQQMTASSSTDWKFGNDQTAFRIIQRVDGQPWIKSAITPRNGGSTLSPFVELANRA